MSTEPPRAPRAADPALLTRAHVLPLAVFMGFMLLLQLAAPLFEWNHPDAPWWRRDPAQIFYPLQTLVTAALLWRFRKCYVFNMSWKWGSIAVVCGALGIAIWLLPSAAYDWLGLHGKPGGLLGWLGVDARRDGFDPGIFHNPAAYWASLVMRFFRAAVVVAFAEEIFWRGFLMRFVCDWDGDYWRQPFGRPAWISYFIVTAAFTLAHAPVDYAAAWIYGSLTYLLCVASKSLGACVLMHATANFLMGLYIMQTGKFGLW